MMEIRIRNIVNMEDNKLTQTKVSMVMPVYNNKDEIGVMLESIYNQVWDNIELIMVNDGATDGTREILSQWEQKLINRGYTVLIIDQENQGISAAVRNGMFRMTGDYFCSVDCDDYLYPEYVSTMATWLDDNPEYDYTACGFERILGTKEKWIIKHCDDGMPETLSSQNLAENMLLHRINFNSWNYLVRMTYLKKCKVIKNFVTEPRLHQEPSISMPLALGQGRIMYFPQVLYRHFLLNREMSLTETEERMPGYIANFTNVLRTVINSFSLNDERCRKKLLAICDFFEAKVRFILCGGFHNNPDEEERFATQLAELANRYFLPKPEISVDMVLLTGINQLFIAIEDCILEKDNEPFNIKLRLNDVEQIIYCGALGKVSNKLLPALMKTMLKPDIMWDEKAHKDSSMYGVNIKKPDLSAPSINDLFIVMPSSKDISKEIIQNLNEAGFYNIISHNEIVEYLCEFYYPTLYFGESKFVCDIR